MPRTREEILALHHHYWDEGETLEQVGQRIGVSRESVRQLFVREELPTRSLDERMAISEAEDERLLAENRERVEALYREHGTIDAVLTEVDISRRLVTTIIDEMPNREAYRRRGSYSSAPQEKLIADIRSAARQLGEPLSGTAYHQNAATLGVAAYNTQIRAFGSWPEALKAAGVQGNPPRGRRTTTTSLEECVSAVVTCMYEHGQDRVSYATYERWASQHPAMPSGSTVRLMRDANGERLGWAKIVALALDSMP